MGEMPAAIYEAVPVECPKGSVIVFHGATWHGAYPREIDGLRITISNYYRHASVQPQDDIQHCFPRDLAKDCDDPKSFHELAGFATASYQRQVIPVPKATGKKRAPGDAYARL